MTPDHAYGEGQYLDEVLAKTIESFVPSESPIGYHIARYPEDNIVRLEFSYKGRIFYVMTLDAERYWTEEAREILDRVRLLLSLYAPDDSKSAIETYLREYGAGEPISIDNAVPINECILHALKERGVSEPLIARARYLSYFIDKTSAEIESPAHACNKLSEIAPRILAYWWDENSNYYILKAIQLPEATEQEMGASVHHIRACNALSRILEDIAVYEDINEHTGEHLDAEDQTIITSASGQMLIDEYQVQSLREQLQALRADHGDVCVVLDKDFSDEQGDPTIRQWTMKICKHRTVCLTTKEMLEAIENYITSLLEDFDAEYSPISPENTQKEREGKNTEFVWNPSLNEDYKPNLRRNIEEILTGMTRFTYSFDIRQEYAYGMSMTIVRLHFYTSSTNASPETPIQTSDEPPQGDAGQGD